MGKWFWFSLVLFSLSANGQPAQINGFSENWKGKQIRLLSLSDPITKTYQYIDETTIAKDGTFTLKVDLKNTGIYHLAVNRFRAPIWLEPKTAYEITILPNEDNIPVETWKYGSFEYALSTADSNDVNYQISTFNTAFYNFYLDNAQFIGSHSLKNKTDAFEKNILTDKDLKPFAKSYIAYSLAEMKLSSGYNKKDLYDTYLKHGPILFENPAYYKFFDLFYADYFRSFDSRFGGATISNRLRMGMDNDSLFSMLKRDPFMENDTLEQLVIIHSIANVYTNRAYSRTRLLEILDAILAKPLSTTALEIGNALRKKITHPLIGSDITTYNDLWSTSWETHPDTLPTVVLVSYEGSMNSQREALILQSLAEKYASVVHFAEIRIGAKEAVQEALWPVYLPANEFSFMEEFAIYTFPQLIWLSGDNKIEQNAIEKPSDGLESRLYKLKSAYDDRNKIKVGK